MCVCMCMWWGGEDGERERGLEVALQDCRREKERGKGEDCMYMTVFLSCVCV